MRRRSDVSGTRVKGLLPLLLALACALVAAGCGSSSTTAGSTPTPHSIAAYTCAANNLPVGSSYTQKSCSLSQVNNVEILRASYVGPKGGSSTVVNTTRLQADRWQDIEQESVGTAPASSSGDALFFNQRAWLTYHYDNAAGTLSLEEAIPTDLKALVSCGQTLTTGAAQIQGLPLPSSAVTTDAGLYTVVPACLTDLKAYYLKALAAAGWKQVQGFQGTPSAGAATSALLGKYSLNGKTLAIWLSGATGTCTAIIVRSST